VARPPTIRRPAGRRTRARRVAESAAVGRLAASLLGIVLRGACARSNRERTRGSRWPSPRDRRVKAIERYRDFIDSAPTASSCSTARARSSTSTAPRGGDRYARDGLAGKPIVQIVPSRSAPRWNGRSARRRRQPSTTSISSCDDVGRSHHRLRRVDRRSVGARDAIFSFRDVTLARELDRDCAAQRVPEPHLTRPSTGSSPRTCVGRSCCSTRART